MMKRMSLLLWSIAMMNIAFAQTYSPDFLDGRIMLKLKKEVIPTPDQLNRTDKNSFSIEEDLSKYPQINNVLKGIGVTKFERPSYYTGKKELIKIYRVTFTNYAKIDEMVERLSKLDVIEFAEKEPIYKIDFVPNDTYYNGTNKWYHTLVGSEAAWDISTGSNSIKVAIVDNAVFTGHSDLTTFAQRDVADNDNDPTPPQDYNTDQGWSHGTHCSGLATADINNNTGIASLGGNVELIGVKATPNSGSSGSVYYSYDGVQWACNNGANVVSMSFGSSTSSASFQTLVNAYPDVVFLAAAGNDNATTLNYPGAYNNVICVGSVDANDSRSFFSNYNGSTPYVDIASPGGYSNGGLLSTIYTTGGNSYAKMAGTSMATPFAAGLVGLMLSLNPAMTPAQIEACLISSGATINQNIGPRIDALAALQCVQATLTGDPIPAFTGSPISISEGQTVTFTDNSSGGGNPITNWSWSFSGGTPNSYVGQTPPPITYSTVGVYDVTLTVTNSQSSVPLTKTGYINVSLVPYGEWIKQNSGFSTASRGIDWISIVDANTVWATAYDGSGGGANVQEFTKTTDGGNTWTPGTIDVGNTGLGISMVHAIDANTAWLAAYPNAGGQTGGIWKTTDGGSTWTRQNSATYNNASSFTNVVYFWDANTGFCQGDPINGEFELYTTTDGGTTWTLVPGANIPNPLSGEYGYTRQIEVVGNDVWYTTNKGRIYHSTDQGLNWTVSQTPLTDFGGTGQSGNMSFKDGSTGLIIDNAGIVYETTDGGANWNTVTTTGSVFTNGLCYIEGTSTVFSTGANPAGSSYSQDGGVTWNIIDSEQHLYCEFTTPSIGWSGWFNQSATQDGMWKWNNTSSALTADFQATPSLACTSTTVQFNDLSSGSTPISWSWVFQGGTPSTSNVQNPSVTYSTPGYYTVSLTVDDGNGPTTKIDSAHVEIVGPTSTPSAIAGNTVPCENDVETYSVTNVPGVFYAWTLPTGWTGSSSTSSITATVGASAGNIEVTADNVCGSSSPSILAVTLCTVGIDEVNKTGLSIYPNPGSSLINIENLFTNDNIKNKDIKIVDVLGKTVLNDVAKTAIHQIDISNLSNGLYFILLDDGNLTYKFIKE